jgi:hypothetical protein
MTNDHEHEHEEQEECPCCRERREGFELEKLAWEIMRDAGRGLYDHLNDERAQ